MKVGIEILVRHLPKKIARKEDFSYLKLALENLPKDKRDAFSITPDEVRIYSGRKGGRAINMAIDVSQEAIKQSGLSGEDIDFVLGAEASIHKEIGLKLDTPMLNVADCCASFLDLLQIAWMLVEAGEARRVLVVASAALGGGEPWSTTDVTDPIAPNFGDGAAAVIVSSQNLKCEFLSYDAGIDGRAYHSACGDISPLRNPDLAEVAGAKCPYGPFFRMDDISYIKVATERGYLGNSIIRMCEKADIKPSDIDFFISHHLGDCEGTWKSELSSCGSNEEIFHNLRLKYGNTGHTDIPTDLLYFVEQNQIKRGSIVVLWVPGSGASLAGLLLRWI